MEKGYEIKKSAIATIDTQRTTCNCCVLFVHTAIKTDKPIQLSMIADNRCTLKSMQRVVDPCVSECGVTPNKRHTRTRTGGTGVYEAGRESSQYTHYNKIDNTTVLMYS